MPPLETKTPRTSTSKKPLAPSISSSRAACAACKHQRRRCSAYCPLAPYFPAENQKDFHNVHRLFGISNVVKLLDKVPLDARDTAIKSVIYHANIRAMNPVGGCHALILDLNRQIAICTAELQIVAQNIAFQRAKLLRRFDSCDFDENSLLKNRESDFGIGEIDEKFGIVEQILNDKPSLIEE